MAFYCLPAPCIANSGQFSQLQLYDKQRMLSNKLLFLKYCADEITGLPDQNGYVLF